MAEGQRDRSDAVLLVLFWTLPLLAAAGLLVAAGLPQLAVALVVIEALMGLAVAVAVRRPDARASRPARPWAVPAAMLAVLVGLVGVTLLAARLG